MNIHDRLRTELHERSTHIPVQGAGADAVIEAARARLRRTRIMGGIAATALVVGVTGAALLARDDGDQVQTETAAGRVDDAPDALQSDGEGAPAADDPGGEATDEAAPATDGSDDGDAEGLANTDAETGPAADPEPDVSTEDPADASGSDDTEDPADPAGSGAPGVSAPAALDLVAHNGGFVAQRSSTALAFSTDGVSWSSIASPNPGGHIVDIVSHDGVLYAAGVDRPGSIHDAWAARSTDLSSWTPIEIPQPDDDGSELTTVVNTVTSIAAGPGGLIVTGETVADIDIGAILSTDVFESESWTLGDATGDLTKIVVYDPDSGDPTEEIDLADAGIPAATLELWAASSPTPFVATGTDTLTVAETNLEPGTILRNATAGGAEILATGHSPAYSSDILWSSTDGQAWEAIPVSVVTTRAAEVIGWLGSRVAVFSSQGPLFTVQVRDGGDWREARLHEDFGGANDTYRLLDAAFDSTGVAAAVSTTDEAGNVTVHLLTSTDGLNWTIAELSDVADAGATVISVDSLAVSGQRVGVSYRQQGGGHETAVLPISLR